MPQFAGDAIEVLREAGIDCYRVGIGVQDLAHSVGGFAGAGVWLIRSLRPSASRWRLGSQAFRTAAWETVAPQRVGD